MALTRLVVDTSAYSSFFNGTVASLKPFFSSHYSLYMPLVVLGELRAGFAAGSRRNHNEQRLSRFLSAPNVEIIEVSDKTTYLYGRIFAELRKTGKSISTNDIWIAALTIEYKASLLTLDSGFKHISQLQRVDLGNK